MSDKKVFCQKCGNNFEDLGQGISGKGKKYGCRNCDEVYVTINGADVKARDPERLVFLEKLSEYRAREGVPVRFV